ncbi:MAG: radical SAM protein [Deltaproteobacteria bacterium]|nr:radical SAM protein [Deltaproteobacteria bacterium]
MSALTSLATSALGRGVQALLPTLRRHTNEALVGRLASLGLTRGTGRDSAHFFLNFLRHADGRGLSPEALSGCVERYLLRPLVASEHARLQTRARHNIAGLRSLILSPTVACNLRCEHCYNLYEIHEDGRDRLTRDAMTRVVREARALGAYRVSVIGGEPLLRWRDLVAVAQDASDVLFTVFSNGHLLTDEVAEALVAAGNVELAVSIDGPKHLHDVWRGEGSYERATSALTRYVEAGGMGIFAPTVTRENYKILLSDDFIDAMLACGAYMGYLHHYDLLGGQQRTDWLLDDADLRWMQARIETLHRDRPLSLMSNVVSDLLRGGCPAVRDFVHVNHKGEVEPCCMVPFAADSVYAKPLHEILRSRFFQDIRDASADDQGIKRCLVGENLVVLKRAVDRDQARPTTRPAMQVFAQHDPEVLHRMPTCFSVPTPT